MASMFVASFSPHSVTAKISLTILQPGVPDEVYHGISYLTYLCLQTI